MNGERPLPGPTKRLRHRQEGRRRNADPRLPLTRGGLRNVGGDQLAWADPVGTSGSGDVRALRILAPQQDVPAEIRSSTYRGSGYVNVHPPYQFTDDVASVTMGAGSTSTLLFEGDYTRHLTAVEGGCGFGLTSSTAGDTYTTVVSLQPSLIYIPAGISLTNVTANNCTATVSEITEQKFNLNVTSTAGGAFLYEAHYATLTGSQGGGGGGGGTGPTFGIDRIANQLHNPAWYPDFIVCRRSDGLSHDSDTYATAVFNEATAAGKLILFYHYGRVGGTAEADVFTAAVGRTVGVGNEKNYGMAFDWEEHATSQAATQAFMNRVRANTGGKCGLYTFWYFLPGGYPYGIGQDWNWVSYVVHPNHVPPGPYDIWQYNVDYTFEPPYGVDQDRSEMSKADLLAKVT